MPYSHVSTALIRDLELRRAVNHASALLADVYTMLSVDPPRGTNGGRCNFSVGLLLACLIDGLATEVRPVAPTGLASRPKRMEALTFLRDFVESISRPVRKDGREHIDYVPSQVVCEYFATQFTIDGDVRLDGIAYPSTVRAGGTNLVLFPTKRKYSLEFAQVEFVSEGEHYFDDWADLVKALS